MPWQPVLYGLWTRYNQEIGWWILAPIWLLAGSPALTFLWFYNREVRQSMFRAMLLLIGPVTSITVGWLFWSCYLLGRWMLR